MVRDRELRAEPRETPAFSNVAQWEDEQIWQRRLKRSGQSSKRRRCGTMEAKEKTVFQDG